MKSFTLPSFWTAYGRLRGDIIPVKGPSDVQSAVTAVHEVLQESFGRLDIAVRVELRDALPHVQCGKSDLERLLFNLMTNARDALLNGGTLEQYAQVLLATNEEIFWP